MSKREPVHDRYKGQVYGQDAVSAAPGEVAARIEATQGSERLWPHCSAITQGYGGRG
jgi:hypothetical protein